jgi:hypothetical protein
MPFHKKVNIDVEFVSRFSIHNPKKAELNAVFNRSR